MKRKNKDTVSSVLDVMRRELTELQERRRSIERERSSLEERKQALKAEIVKALVAGEKSEEQESALSQVENRLSLVSDAMNQVDASIRRKQDDIFEQEKSEAVPVLEQIEVDAYNQLLNTVRALFQAHKEAELFGELSAYGNQLAGKYDFRRGRGTQLVGWNNKIREEIYSLLYKMSRDDSILEDAGLSLKELRKVGTPMPQVPFERWKAPLYYYQKDAAGGVHIVESPINRVKIA